MEENINENIEEEVNENEGPEPLIPQEIYLESKYFCYDNYKRFLPYILICVFNTILTFSSFLFSLLYDKVGFSAYLFSVVLFIVFFIFILFPSLYSFKKIILLQTIKENDVIEGRETKDINYKKEFFSRFYDCYKGLFFKTNNILIIFLKTLLFFIVFGAIILIFSLLIRTQFDSELNDSLNNLFAIFGLSDFSSVLESIKDLIPSIKIELIIINTSTLFFLIHSILWNEYYIAYIVNTTTLNKELGQLNKKVRKVHKNTIKSNRWEFYFYYFYAFKYIYLIFILLTIGLNVGFYFVFDNALVISSLSILISMTLLSFIYIYFLKSLIEISYSFTDLYFIELVNQTRIQMEKISKLFKKDNISVKEKTLDESKNSSENVKEKELSIEEALKQIDEIQNKGKPKHITRKERYKEYNKIEKQKHK